MAMQKVCPDAITVFDDCAFFDQFKTRPMTIVAVGKTGKGKSATLNSLISLAGKNGDSIEAFRSCDGPSSCSRAVDWRDIQPAGFCEVRLVDTIGLFDTELTSTDQNRLHLQNASLADEEHRQVLQQFVQVMEKCKEGIDAFLFVLRANDRSTREEFDTIDIIFRCLGWNMLDYVIFVITGKDTASEMSFDAWRDRVGDFMEKRGYPRSRVQSRFVFLDNFNPSDAQAYELLGIVRYVSDMNHGRPYTPATFEEAQVALEEEKQRIRIALQTQFQGKMDEALTSIQECHAKVITDLQHEFNQITLEAQKVDDENVAERQHFNAKLEALRRAQDDEKRRLEKEMMMKINLLEMEKSQAYDRERVQMQEMMNNLKAEIQRNRPEIEAMIRQADENLAAAKIWQRRSGGCNIM